MLAGVHAYVILLAGVRAYVILLAGVPFFGAKSDCRRASGFTLS